MAGQCVLLVEGQGDRDFFQHFLCHLQLDIKIEPETPRDFCQTTSDGVDVLRKFALPVALQRIKEGDISHLGVVVDADSELHSNGFSNRRKQITELLEKAGYHIPEASDTARQGEIFTHPDEYPGVGLWIMPNHSADGMLEDLFLDNLPESGQTELLNKADEAISNLGDLQLFKDTHLSKARLSTLLAWQRKPGISAGKAYQSAVFATDSSAFSALTQWLENVFKDKNND